MSDVIRPDQRGVFPVLADGVYDVALGNSSQYRIGLQRLGARIFVAVSSRGAYEFVVPPDPGYVEEKLRLAPFDGDAQNLADFIADQLTSGEPPCRRHGTYQQSLTRKRAA